MEYVPFVLKAAFPFPPNPPVATTRRWPTSVSSPTTVWVLHQWNKKDVLRKKRRGKEENKITGRKEKRKHDRKEGREEVRNEGKK